MMFSLKSNWPPRLLTVPGLYGSGEAHWQSWLERQFSKARRVQQDNWEQPELGAWSDAVRAALEDTNSPCVLAAHSFGCLATVHALRRHWENVAGVLLVAPASPAKFDIGRALEYRRLPVPSIVVSSENDPWITLGEARTLASAWGSAFINLGHAGHVNAAAGFGPWPRAKFLVDTLVHCAAPLRFKDEPAYLTSVRPAL